jgi:hypothetical protein
MPPSNDLIRTRNRALLHASLTKPTAADSRVRGEIESMESQRKTLANQLDFATLNATVNEDYKAQLQVVPPSTSTQFRNAAVDGYRSMIDGIVGVAVFLFSYGPSLLFWCSVPLLSSSCSLEKVAAGFLNSFVGRDKDGRGFAGESSATTPA